VSVATHHDAEIAAALASMRRTYAQKAIRQQFGESMLALGRERSDFLVLTADLMFATGMAGFGAEFPERLLNVGIAEQNLTGIATGLALCGKLPVVCGYAAFMTLRAAEQAKVDAAYNGAKLILAAQSAGLSYGVGGPTHQSYEDVAIMRAIPNTVVLVPSDASEVDKCLRAALDYELNAPIYIRLGRGPEYVFNASDAAFEIGRAATLREGRDICLVANGSMVFEALLAADFLAGFGIAAHLLNVHTVKPLDEDAVRRAAAGASAMIVVEEHSRFGGLGAAILEALAETRAPPCRLLGLSDTFPPIGPASELRAALGLSAEAIVHNALELLKPIRIRGRAMRLP
jgi:transketolase